MKRFLAFIFCALMPYVAHASELDAALRATYMACVGIDDELADLKKMAGINTAVTSVGVAAGAGAAATGFIKQSTDNKIADIEIKLEKLRGIETASNPASASNDEINAFVAEFEQSADSARGMADAWVAELDKLNQKSKRLGNWRTGLLAGNTATNIAGAVIAGRSRANMDLQTMINECRAAVNALRHEMMQAHIAGEDISDAQNIVTACSDYDYVDVSKINNRARGAEISSIVGATVGAAGVVTSAIANTDNTRNDNSDAGRKTERGLNTASNALAIGATAASTTATVFNATQISAIKKVAAAAARCDGALRE